jgi:hypothetical protein
MLIYVYAEVCCIIPVTYMNDKELRLSPFAPVPVIDSVPVMGKPEFYKQHPESDRHYLISWKEYCDLTKKTRSNGGIENIASRVYLWDLGSSEGEYMCVWPHDVAKFEEMLES